MKHIVSFSGGKDSLAMLLKMIENNMPIDEIICCDVEEFQEVIEIVGKIKILVENAGIKFTVFKSEKGFEYYLKEHLITRGKNKDTKGYGFPRIRNRWCTSKLKIELINKYIKKEYGAEQINMYIGIALDEPIRIGKGLMNYPKNFVPKYPLYSDFKMTEKECLKYCYDKGFNWNGLYNHFNRLSCWCCPLQSQIELKKLYLFFPDKWKKLKEWELEVIENYKYKISGFGSTFKIGKTLEELEKKFKKKEFKLFNLS